MLVQQALSLLVNDPGPENLAQAVMKVDRALAAVTPAAQHLWMRR